MAHRTYDSDQVNNFISEIPNWHTAVQAMKKTTDGVILPPAVAGPAALPSNITGPLPSQPSLSLGRPFGFSGGGLLSVVRDAKKGKMPDLAKAAENGGLVGNLAKFAQKSVDKYAPDNVKQAFLRAQGPDAMRLPTPSPPPSPTPSPPSATGAPHAPPPSPTPGAGSSDTAAGEKKKGLFGNMFKKKEKTEGELQKEKSDKDKDKDLSRQEVVGNIFTYVYLFLACIAILGAISMIIFSWTDLREIQKYKRVTRPDENMLLFKDTMEHDLFNHTSRFNVFSEAMGSLNVVMSMGIHMLSLLLVQMLISIVIKIALDGGNWSDAIKAFKNQYFLFIIILFGIQLMLVMCYYFELNRKKFNGYLLGQVFQNKLDKMDDMRGYIVKNLYNGTDNTTFYSKLINSVHDHGRSFRAYLADNAKTRNTHDVAKMMFTFNVFNFYISQYNTVENFIGTPMYKFFANSPANSRDIDIVKYMNVLAISGGGMVNVFSKNQITLWYSRMFPDVVQRKLALQNSWENRVADQYLANMMTVTNTKLVSTMMEFNWTQYIGAPSKIFKAFKDYLTGRFAYWLLTQLVVLAMIGGVIWKTLKTKQK